MFVFRARVSPGNLGWAGAHYVGKASFKFRDLPASASQVLALKVQATTTGTTIKTQHFVCYTHATAGV